mmetsp:Transcript_21336/g.59255  ORF Transcript_21336/g.59255 Transcript_21336/m.59255 type:complete len:256 (-) Transcript_21336:91-858(-)
MRFAPPSAEGSAGSSRGCRKGAAGPRSREVSPVPPSVTGASGLGGDLALALSIEEEEDFPLKGAGLRVRYSPTSAAGERSHSPVTVSPLGGPRRRRTGRSQRPVFASSAAWRRHCCCACLPTLLWKAPVADLRCPGRRRCSEAPVAQALLQLRRPRRWPPIPSRPRAPPAPRRCGCRLSSNSSRPRSTSTRRSCRRLSTQLTTSSFLPPPLLPPEPRSFTPQRRSRRLAPPGSRSPPLLMSNIIFRPCRLRVRRA